VPERFVEDQAVDAMPACEAQSRRGPVARDALDEVAGDADVERAVTLATHNVDVVGLASGHRSIIRARFNMGQWFFGCDTSRRARKSPDDRCERAGTGLVGESVATESGPLPAQG